MKRWIIYLAALAVLSLLPKGQGTEVGRLEPAQLLHIYMVDGATVVETDTENLGVGKDLSAAITSMKESADAEIFLDTVAYVLVTEDTKDLLPELGKLLRPGTKVALATTRMEVKELADFLQIHDPEVRLRDCMVGQPELPKLMTAGERCYLVQ